MAVGVKLCRLIPGLADVFGSEEDFVQQFSAAWKKVRTMPGEDILGAALRMSLESPLMLRKEHEDVTPGYVRFISFAGWLCVAAGTDRVKLPCREVGEALGVNKLTVSSYRQQAVTHGYLLPLKKHTFRPGGGGEATLFRFRVEWWPCLREKVAASDSTD
jgi:hypothetical protein